MAGNEWLRAVAPEFVQLPSAGIAQYEKIYDQYQTIVSRQFCYFHKKTISEIISDDKRNIIPLTLRLQRLNTPFYTQGSLEPLLKHYLEIKCKITSLNLSTIKINKKMSISLEKGQYQLGHLKLLGDLTYTLQHVIRLKIIAQNLEQYKQLLPKKKLNQTLNEWLTWFYQSPQRYVLELYLDYKDLPRTQLSNKKALKLGEDTWLTSSLVKKSTHPIRGNCSKIESMS